MKKQKYIRLILAYLVVLQGCREVPVTYNNAAQEIKYRQELAETLRSDAKKPPLDRFSEFLKQGYVALSDARWYTENKGSSKIYAQKALAVMQGVAVLPETVDESYFGTPARKESLYEAEAFLVEQLNRGIQGILPEEAARAQVMFDCWVEQAVIAPISDEYNYCQGEFFKAQKNIKNFAANPQALDSNMDSAPQMDSYQSAPQISSSLSVKATSFSPASIVPQVSSPQKSAPAANSVSLPEILSAIDKSKKKKTASSLDYPYGQEGMYGFTADGMPEAYLLDFDSDHVRLSEKTKQILDEIIEDIEIYRPDRLLITGHADPSGPADYNLDLSEDRVWSITGYLRFHGISLSLFDDMRAYGENSSKKKPADPTKAVLASRYTKIQFLKLKSNKNVKRPVNHSISRLQENLLPVTEPLEVKPYNSNREAEFNIPKKETTLPIISQGDVSEPPLVYTVPQNQGQTPVQPVPVPSLPSTYAPMTIIPGATSSVTVIGDNNSQSSYPLTKAQSEPPIPPLYDMTLPASKP